MTGVVFCCCSPSASKFNELCVQRWSSAYLGCNKWLLELDWPWAVRPSNNVICSCRWYMPARYIIYLDIWLFLWTYINKLDHNTCSISYPMRIFLHGYRHIFSDTSTCKVHYLYQVLVWNDNQSLSVFIYSEKMLKEDAPAKIWPPNFTELFALFTFRELWSFPCWSIKNGAIWEQIDM